MWHKVVWLTFWVSMVLWFGQLWGCAAPGEDQNYKVLEDERRSIFDHTESNSLSPNDAIDNRTSRGPVQSLFIALADNDDAAAQAADAQPGADAGDKADDDAKADDKSQPPADKPVIETEPSLKGLDRSHWPKIPASPARGIISHRIIYYRDLSADRPEPQVDFNDPVEKQLEASLAGACDHRWDGHHMLLVPKQDFKFMFDTVTFPFRLFLTPPWTGQTTP